jgi:DNA invertase Pin-like site-specific DNA recombinase
VTVTRDPEQIRERLRRVAERRRAAEREDDEIADEIRDSINEARDANISMTEVARLLEIDRTSMYRTYINGHH